MSAIVALVAVGAVLATLGALRRRTAWLIAPLAASLLVASVGSAYLLLPEIDRLRTIRPVIEVLQRELAPGEPFGIFAHVDGRVIFYMGRPGVELHTESELRSFAERGGRWVVARRKDLDKTTAPLPYETLTGDRASESGVVLLRAAPDATAP